MRQVFEVRVFGHVNEEFDSFELAEGIAERWAIAGHHVELLRWVVRPNLPGALPDEVYNIIRLDTYQVVKDRVTRVWCSLF